MKDYLDSLSQRVRSPFGGYTIASFLAINWQEVFYLFFSDQSASIRIRFFDLRSSWFDLIALPVLFGAILAIGLPWLNFAVAFCIRMPVGKHRQLQMTETISNKVHQINDSTRIEEAEAKSEKVRENRKIEGARRLKEARAVNSEGLENAILQDREATIVPQDSLLQILFLLGDLEKIIIVKLGGTSDRWQQGKLLKDNQLRFAYEEFTNGANDTRYEVDLRTAVKRLILHRLLNINERTDELELTETGYKAFDFLRE